jgi:IS30 family transposase
VFVFFLTNKLLIIISTHTKLTKDERIEIATFLKAGCSQTQIAYHLKKNKSTISREITRNKDPVKGEYKYSFTHVDRKSGYLIADKVEVATAEAIQTLTINSFNKLPKTKVKSITYDNGVQFSKY